MIRELSPRIWMKLATIGLSFAIPLLLTTYFLVNESNIKIDFARQELRGDRYLRPLSRLLLHVGRHRSAAQRRDGAEASRTEALVDADFHDLLAVDRDLHGPLKTTSAALSARGRASAAPARLMAVWTSVKQAGDVGAGDLHDRLLRDIRTLITVVGDSSKLILDPDLDTYYVMDALLLQEPELIDGLSRLGDAVDQLPAGGAGITADQQATLAGDVALFRFHVDALETDLRTAFAETKNFNKNSELQRTLEPLLARAVDTATALADRTTPSVDHAAYDGTVRKAIAANSALWSGLFDQEDKMLHSRQRGGVNRRRFEIAAVAFAVLLSVLLTFLVARRISRNVATVASAASLLAAGDLSSRARIRSRDEVGAMADAFNTMAAQLASASLVVTSAATKLNSAADALAATTSDQSAAVAEASATTEQLARASVSIAETVDGVATQAAATRNSLQQAEGEIEVSSERTLALAGRVGEIDAILALINDIANQTHLLALNAAIEAAHAGEGGQAFAVVAEEIRQLAERSKASAADISSIIEGIRAETDATVTAMAKGATTMRAGVTALSAVAESTELVRLTTQQQRTATSQVVETMERLRDVSRQVSEASGQIASASAALATLAAKLGGTTAAATAPVD